jgi:hypothetical protein
MEFDWKDGGLGVAIFFDRSVPGGNRGIPRNDACGVFIVPRSCPGYRRAAATLRSGDVSASTFLHLCLWKSVVAARHLLRHNFRFEGQGKR